MLINNFIRKIKTRFSGKFALKHMQDIIALRPITIAIQAHDACNAACVFCARRKIKPTRTTMSMELFEKVCKDYSDIGGGHMGFSPLIADPLVDPLFMDRIKILIEKYQKVIPNIFTNGIAFERFSDNEIVTLLQAVHHIDISIGGFSSESYRIMYGRDKFNIIWEQLNRLSKLNSEKKILKLHIRTNLRKSILKSERLQEIRQLGYECTDIVDIFSNWGGLVSEEDLPQGARIAKVDNSHQTIECFSPMYNMMIMQDGKVIACGCMDAREQFTIGHISQQSIVEIWRSTQMQSIRNAFKAGNMPEICRSCGYYTPYEQYYKNIGLLNYSPSKDFWSSLQ